MAQFKKKNTYKFWHSPLALVVLFLILVLFMYNMVSLIRKQRETARNKASQLHKIEELTSRQKALTADIDKLNTDEGIEASVRDKFQVVKPGEKEVLIVQNEEVAEDQNKDQKQSFFNKIKSFFGF